MNLLLFEPDALGRPLAADAPQARHLTTVLKRGVGDRFDAGLVDGPRGKGRILAIEHGRIEWTFEPGAEPILPLDPIELIVGMPRPQTGRKILQEAAALGVRAMSFIVTDKAEAGYAQSGLWTGGEWRRHLIAGTEQAFSTRLPEVRFNLSLEDAIERGGAQSVLALDNYESPLSLATAAQQRHVPPVAVVIGAERGWSAAERDLLRAHGAKLVHLGKRVLRTETACVAALTLVKAALGTFEQ